MPLPVNLRLVHSWYVAVAQAGPAFGQTPITKVTGVSIQCQEDRPVVSLTLGGNDLEQVVLTVLLFPVESLVTVW